MSEWNEAAWQDCVEAGDWQTYTRRWAIHDTETACNDSGADEVAELLLETLDELMPDFQGTSRKELAAMQTKSGMSEDEFTAAVRALYQKTFEETVKRLNAGTT